MSPETTNDGVPESTPPEEAVGLEPVTSDHGGSTPSAQGRSLRRSVIVVAAVLAIGTLLVGWTVWTSLRPTASTPSSAAANTSGLVSQADLAALVGTLGHSLYWAGDQGLTTYELSATKPNTYIRYLPSGVAAGSTDQYLTVATYEQQNAYQGLESAAKSPGATWSKLSGGALVVQPGDKPKSAYFAFPQANLLMEVFDPTPGRAYELIRTGVIQPVP